MNVIESATRRWGRGSVWVALLAFAPLGCALNDAPTGPQAEQDPFEMFDQISPPTPGKGISVGPGGSIIAQTSNALTKPTGRVKTVTKRVSAHRGGRVIVLNTPTLARLTVLPGSMEEDNTIEMTSLGSMGSIGIEFGPDGLHFTPSAVLDIVRPIGDLDPDDLQLYLTSADGSVEKLEVEVLTFGGWMRVRTWIAHFSAVGDDEDDGRSGDEENPES